MGLKKSTPPPETKPKTNPVAMPTPLVPDLKNPSVPVVAKRPANDFGPSEALNQPIASAQAELPPADAGAPVGGLGGFGGAGVPQLTGGAGSTSGGDGVLNVGNFPPPAGGGGGGPFTYIKTGPGDWLQAGGGGGEAAFTGFSGGGGAEYDQPAAPKTASPAEQILRVGVLEPVASASSARGTRGLAGANPASTGRGVFSQRPTMTALCALGRMALCENPKRFVTRPTDGVLRR